MHYEVIRHPERSKVFLECTLLNSGLRLGQSTKRPAVVICPGGGYIYKSPREGEPVAAANLAKGIHAFILQYSVGWDVTGGLEHQDYSTSHIMEEAKKLGLDLSGLAGGGNA